MVLGAFNPATNTGVLQLSDCGPNGITVDADNLRFGCTQANNPANRAPWSSTPRQALRHVNGIVGVG